MFSAPKHSPSLQYQLNRMEAKLDLLLNHAGLSLPADPLTIEVKNLLRNRQKIAAIKRVREMTGMGLKEAKDWVAALETDV